MAHFPRFVLCNFVLGVLLTALTLAVGAASLGNVDLIKVMCISPQAFVLLSVHPPE